jgi:hypothetical protein
MNKSSISKSKKSVFCSYLNGRYNSSFDSSNSMLNKNRNHGIISYSNGVPYVNMVWVNRHLNNSDIITEYNPNKEI